MDISVLPLTPPKGQEATFEALMKRIAQRVGGSDDAGTVLWMKELIEKTLTYGADASGKITLSAIDLRDMSPTQQTHRVLNPQNLLYVFSEFRNAGLEDMIHPVKPMTVDAAIPKLQAAFDEAYPDLKGQSVPMAHILLSALRFSQQNIFPHGIVLYNHRDEAFLKKAMHILSDTIPECAPKSGSNLPFAIPRDVTTDAAGYRRLIVDGQLQDDLLLNSVQHALAKKLTSLDDMFRSNAYVSFGPNMKNGMDYPHNAFAQVTGSAMNIADLHTALASLHLDGTKPVEISREQAFQIYPRTTYRKDYEPRLLVLGQLKAMFPKFGAEIERHSTHHPGPPPTLTLVIPPDVQQPLITILNQAKQVMDVQGLPEVNDALIKNLGIPPELAARYMDSLKGTHPGAQIAQSFLAYEVLKQQVGGVKPDGSGNPLYPKLSQIYDLLQKDTWGQAYPDHGVNYMIEAYKMVVPDLQVSIDAASGAESVSPSEHDRAAAQMREINGLVNAGKLGDAEARLGNIEKRHTRKLERAEGQAAAAEAEATRQAGTRAAAELARRDADALAARTEKLRTTYGHDMDTIAALATLIDDRMGAGKQGNATGDRYIEKDGHVLINCGSDDERTMLKELLRGVAGKGFLMDIANPERTHGLAYPLRVSDAAMTKIRENFDEIRKPYHDALQAVKDNDMTTATTKMEEAAGYLGLLELNANALSTLSRAGSKSVA